ncbi:MAG: hypothetical protein CVV44_08685 [Spirochaetae bacterium HGW-Spirochaetae-1]|jgi:hypothetical protein|nr:MAG: hypothetical protein CVV44_08685 [Spirochaetae bacterium HGW-Spirochaetae-1]
MKNLMLSVTAVFVLFFVSDLFAAPRAKAKKEGKTIYLGIYGSVGVSGATMGSDPQEDYEGVKLSYSTPVARIAYVSLEDPGLMAWFDIGMLWMGYKTRGKATGTIYTQELEYVNMNFMVGIKKSFFYAGAGLYVAPATNAWWWSESDSVNMAGQWKMDLGLNLETGLRYVVRDFIWFIGANFKKGIVDVHDGYVPSVKNYDILFVAGVIYGLF